jgi:hypothetical protein
MTLLAFILLSLANLALICVMVRRRGIASAEGLCLAYLGIAAASDNGMLLFHFIFSRDALPLGYREFAFRLYPTALEILGLLVLFAALELMDGNPRALSRELATHELCRLRNLGIAIAAFGGILTIVALWLVGAFSAASFYSALNLFRDQALPFGGFWYRGADIAVFGLALMLPSMQDRMKRFTFVLALMMLVAFFLRTNKGGLEEAVIWGALVLYVYKRPLLRKFLRLRTAALVLVVAFFGVGAKFWILPHATGRASSQPSFSQLVTQASAAAVVRWSDDGLYRGYCQFVNSLPDNRALFPNYKVGVYSLTSWVPRFVYPHKPDHPFRGLGYMIYSDFHTFDEETPAPMLIGSAMADYGITSLIAYLALAGVFLGILRRFAASTNTLSVHCSYLLFVLFGGFSAEEGTLGILYILFLAIGVVAAAQLLLFAVDLVTPRLPRRSVFAAHDVQLQNLEPDKTTL